MIDEGQQPLPTTGPDLYRRWRKQQQLVIFTQLSLFFLSPSRIAKMCILKQWCGYVCMMRYGIIWWVTILVWKSSSTHLWHAYVLRDTQTHTLNRFMNEWKIPFFSSLSISFFIFVYVFIAVVASMRQRNGHHFDEYGTNI